MTLKDWENGWKRKKVHFDSPFIPLVIRDNNRHMCDNPHARDGGNNILAKANSVEQRAPIIIFQGIIWTEFYVLLLLSTPLTIGVIVEARY